MYSHVIKCDQVIQREKSDIQMKVTFCQNLLQFVLKAQFTTEEEHFFFFSITLGVTVTKKTVLQKQ